MATPLAVPDGLHPEQPSIQDLLKSMASFQQQSVAVMSEVHKLLKVNLVIEQERVKREEKQNEKKEKTHQELLQDSRKDLNKRLDALERYLKNLPLELVKQYKPTEYLKAKSKVSEITRKEDWAVYKEKNKQIGESLAWALGEKSPTIKALTHVLSGKFGSKFASRSLQFGDDYNTRLKDVAAPYKNQKEDVWNQLKFEANFGPEAGRALTDRLSKLREEVQAKDVAIADIGFRSMFPEIFNPTEAVKQPRDARGRFISKAAATQPQDVESKFTSTARPRDVNDRFVSRAAATENASIPKIVPMKPTAADVAKAPYELGVGFLYLGNMLQEVFTGPRRQNTKPDAMDLSDATGALGLLKKAAPAISGIAGAAMTLGDIFKAIGLADDWNVDKLSAGIGGAIGGTKSGLEGAFFNGIKGALIGFSLGGPAGALIGLAFGGAAGAVGGEKIAQTVQEVRNEAAAVAKQTKEEGLLSGAWAFITGSDEKKVAIEDDKKIKPVWDQLIRKYGSLGLKGKPGTPYRTILDEFYNSKIRGTKEEINWPKYHNGGKVPYDSYEVPAILRAGERVLTPSMSDVYDQDMKEIMRVSDKLERLDLTTMESILSKILSVVQETIAQSIATGNDQLAKLQTAMQPNNQTTPAPTPVVIGDLR